MKYIVYTLFIALINNLDNIGVRIAYSLRGVKITHPINLWISVITFVISAGAAYSGTLMSRLLSKQLSSVISMSLLTIIGLWIIMEPYLKKNEAAAEPSGTGEGKNLWSVIFNPHHADIDNSKNIEFKEGTVLGIALSLNNIGGGLGAGLIGLDSWLVGLFSAVISFLALWAGNYITDFFMRWKLGNAATLIAGMVLIAIGIEQVL